MKKWPIIISVLGVAAIAVVWGGVFSPTRSFAAVSINKLPYAKGQRFLVSQGYNSLPTHIKKDLYALDFTQNGCDAYGKAVVATIPGKAMFLSQEGYNGGYGTELIIDHGNHIVSRYAHMIPDSITVSANGTIRQGQTIGRLGDTGLVLGATCAEHPGTHLHFAMDTVNSDGTFTAYDPEPISGFTNIVEGKWYVSDNGEDEESSTTAGAVLGANIAIATTTATAPATATITSVSTAVISTSSISPVANLVFGGGGGGSVVEAATGADTSSASATASAPTSTDSVVASSTATSTPGVASSTDVSSVSSSTVDVNTSAGASTSSTPSSTVSSSSSSAASSVTSPILFSQTDDSARSQQSFYDDNWFELGNGFSGTLNALTLEGAVSDVHYYASHVVLQEFKDKNYTALIQEFPISDDAPFTPTMATATFSGLSISLKPYFYYRLATVQDWQNRSVILAGTATTTTGVTMWDNFVYGTGGVEYTAPFFPFMEMDGVAATSTLVPPSLTSPNSITMIFDEMNMQLNVSWSTSTDPDWPANPLHYEMNYSTSSVLADSGWVDSGWTDSGQIPLVIGNDYLIGIRAKDNYGDVSAVATATWDFPPGFTPYILSHVLSHATQYFTIPATSTLKSITLLTTNLQSSARYPEYTWCTLTLYDTYSLSPFGIAPADNAIGGYGCAGSPTFSFENSSIVLSPGHQYEWAFNGQTGNPSTGMGVQFYGTAKNTAGGSFNDPSLANARFTVTGDTGVLFENL